MEELKRYKIDYSIPARQDILAKTAYIQSSFLDRSMAGQWFDRLWNTIQDELSYLPYKYPVYSKGKWRDLGVHIMTVRNDIVLYEIDEDAGVVRVLNVFTRGKDLTRE